MFKRDFTLTTLHGDTDEAARREWWDKNQAALAEIAERHGEEHEPAELVCDVTAVFTDDDAGVINLHVKDWAHAAGLKVGMTVTLTIGG